MAASSGYVLSIPPLLGCRARAIRCSLSPGQNAGIPRLSGSCLVDPVTPQELRTVRLPSSRCEVTPAAWLMAEVGLRVNEVCQLDLDDVKWD